MDSRSELAQQPVEGNPIRSVGSFGDYALLTGWAVVAVACIATIIWFWLNGRLPGPMMALIG